MKTDDEKFTLTDEHLTLLRNAYVGWDEGEFGAPAINCKRPYGNSDVVRDIIELLGETGKACPHCHEALDEVDEARYERLHKETKTALQIILKTGEFKAGVYVCGAYDTNWKLASDD